MKSLKEEKALGLDGFPMRFFLEFWDTIRVEVMKSIDEFHANRSLCKSMNSSLISLIPKKQGATDPYDFCLISLIDGFYKLLKALAWCLEEVMDIIISPSQHAFLKGRQLLDCSLITNKCIDYLVKANKSGVVCQIYMEKACDHVN